MPIYEFYCPDCHRLYNFFSPRVDTAARPDCPRCDRPALERRPARFATLRSGLSKGVDEESDEHFPGIDEGRMEEAFSSMAGELEGLGDDDDDPRTLARLMRTMTDSAGVEPAGAMREFLARLEGGEDPEALESEFEDAFDDDDLSALFRQASSSGSGRRTRPPSLDETLYFL